MNLHPKSRQPPPTRQLPTPPNQLLRPPSHSTDLVHPAKDPAGSVDSTHFRRHSVGSAMMPLPSSSVPEGETSASRRAVRGDGSVFGGSERAHDYPRHRRGSPCQPRWGSYSGDGPLLNDNAAWTGGRKDRDRSSTEGFGEGGDPGAPSPEWRLQSPGEPSDDQYPPLSNPTRAKRMRNAAGDGRVAGPVDLPAPGPLNIGMGLQPVTPSWAVSALRSVTGSVRYREADSPQSTSAQLQSTSAHLQGERYGRGALSSSVEERGTSGFEDLPSSRGALDPRWQSRAAAAAAAAAAASAAAAEEALVTAALNSPLSWDLGSEGQSSFGTKPGQVGGGVESLALGGSRLPGNSSIRGAYMDFGFNRQLDHDDRLRHSSPMQAQYRHQLSQPQDYRQQHHPSQLTSSFPAAGTTVALPRLSGGGRYPGSSITASRVENVAKSAPLLDPWPGPAGAVETLQDRAAGGRRSYNFGELHEDSGRYGGLCSVGAGVGGHDSGAAAACGASAKGGGEHRRQTSDLTPTAFSACMEDGCGRRPRFAFKGSKRLAYCGAHRLPGMVDVRHPRCKDEQCTKQPSFGLEGDRRPSYCATHRKANMINVSSRRCQHFGCLRSPNFGFPGDRRASFCKGHSETGMVDVISRRCEDPSCARRPLYNMIGLRPEFCSQHKLPGMIDVVSARCQEPGCLRHPSFGYISDKKARRCARHRLENMEGLKGRRHPDAAP